MMMKTVNLKIEGMHCGGCVTRVTNILKRVDGVEVEEVQIGSAKLKLASDSSLGGIEETLAKAGYRMAVNS